MLVKCTLFLLNCAVKLNFCSHVNNSPLGRFIVMRKIGFLARANALSIKLSCAIKKNEPF